MWRDAIVRIPSLALFIGDTTEEIPVVAPPFMRIQDSRTGISNHWASIVALASVHGLQENRWEETFLFVSRLYKRLLGRHENVQVYSREHGLIRMVVLFEQLDGYKFFRVQYD